MALLSGWLQKRRDRKDRARTVKERTDFLWAMLQKFSSNTQYALDEISSSPPATDNRGRYPKHAKYLRDLRNTVDGKYLGEVDRVRAANRDKYSVLPPGAGRAAAVTNRQSVTHDFGRDFIRRHNPDDMLDHANHLIRLRESEASYTLIYNHVHDLSLIHI